MKEMTSRNVFEIILLCFAACFEELQYRTFRPAVPELTAREVIDIVLSSLTACSEELQYTVDCL